ncbi:MAG: nucleoside-diphosphate kinase, partial [Treponema sp.]|nr:nucleoside-diphosphate kinase [Treponema sp.]
HLYMQNVGLDALSGETIRDTYSDMIFAENDPEEVTYFEPAVMTPRNQEEANEDLAYIAKFLEGKGNIVQNMAYPDPSKIEQTLVIIKPDNWTHHSSRPGAVIDMFSRTGLRIVGIKIHRLSLAQAMEFYGPVESVLMEKLASGYGSRAREILEREFHLALSKESQACLAETVGVECAKDQYAQIIEFMCGKRPPPEDREYTQEELNRPCSVKCMILIYEGENAVHKIRNVLGPTDPLKAPEGTIRREFGSNIMVNTAHASDSAESYNREKEIVRVNENSLASIIKDHLN